MDISQLKQEILDGKLRPLYVFTGNELALQDVYVNKIHEVSGLDVKRIDYLRLVYSKLSGKTLFKVKPSIYLIRNDEEYLTRESSWETIAKTEDLKGNIIILLYTNIEKNTKFIKVHDSILTKFDYIGANILVNRLVATTNMPRQYCEDIVKLCGNDYGRIKNELYKLYMLAQINNCSLNSAYLEAKAENFIHEDIGDIIFEFTNSIVNRDILKAYDLFDKVMQTEDGNAVKLLTVLYNSFRQILMVQTTLPKDRTEQVLGMSKAQIYVSSQKCNIYNSYELVNIIRTIRYLEKGIKIGTISEEFAMKYFMGGIW